MPDSENTEFPRLNRRDVVAGAAGAALILTLGAAAKAASSGEFIRPPGANNEARFRSLCLGCDKCRSICHTGAIVPADFAAGFLNLRTPIMNFSNADCDYCKRCIEICPTGALEMFQGKTTVIGIAEVTETCIALRTGGCTKCYEVCPYDAITLDEKKCPIVDKKACVGCGRCEKDCPALILQSLRTGSERGIIVRPVKNDGGAR